MTIPPEVSIILPTYNRSDTILRAVKSILSQSYTDFELIIINDGSTDLTSLLILNIDDRIVIINQENQGVAAARNTGLAASRGKYIAFLDSDDEWLPQFLSLAIGFLKSFPDEHIVSLEFLRDGQKMIDASIRYEHSMAKQIGSNALDLLNNESDEYLRVYQSKQPIGYWGRQFLSNDDLSNYHLYQGNIFSHSRWGYLSWLPTFVITRYALETVGCFDASTRGSEDYYFMALAFRHFNANFISIPSAIKHEQAPDSTTINQAHLALGPNHYYFMIERLHYFDKLHLQTSRLSKETLRIRKCHMQKIAKVAIRQGMRKEALQALKESNGLQQTFWRSYLLMILVMIFVPNKMNSKIYKRFLDLLEV